MQEILGAQLWINPDDSTERIADLCKKAREAGLSWLCIFLMWSWIERNTNIYDFRIFDDVFDAAERNNLKIKATLTPNSGPHHIGAPSLLHSHSGFLSDTFVGLRNFKELITSSDFSKVLLFSFVLSIPGTRIFYVIELVLALLFNQLFPFRGIFRALVLLLRMTPWVAFVAGWRWLVVDDTSFLNRFLSVFGIGAVFPVVGKTSAFYFVVLARVWRLFSFVLVTILSFLQTIPKEQLEPASPDGCNACQRFRYIVFPYIKGISIINVVLVFIWFFNVYETIWLLTSGGPQSATENFPILSYRYMFVNGNLGMGAATSVMSFLFVIAFIVIYLKAQRKEHAV